MTPAEANTSPVFRSQRCAATVVEPTSIAIQREPGHTPFTLEGLEQELHFAAGIFEAGLADLHVVKPCGGIQPDIPGFHLFTHDLSVNLTLRGDINHRIIEQGGVAAEAPAFL
jgi:hypothetical protein